MSLVLLTAITSIAGAMPSPQAFPGGVRDEQSTYAFIADQKGGLDAFELATGKLAWHRDDLSYPMLVDKGVLYARVGHDGLRVARADAASGKTRSEIVVSVPSWFSGSDIEMSTCASGANIHIDWHATTSYHIGGMMPDPATLAQLQHAAHHEADDRIDIHADGTIASSGAWCASTPNYAKAPFAGTQRTIWSVAQTSTGTNVIVWERAQQTTLREVWSGGKRTESKKLGGDHTRTSVDGAAVFVATTDHLGRMWDTASGTSSHDLPIADRYGAELAMLGGRVYCVGCDAQVPQGPGRYSRKTLKAFDVVSGKEIWSVAASGFVEPYPPPP